MDVTRASQAWTSFSQHHHRSVFEERNLPSVGARAVERRGEGLYGRPIGINLTKNPSSSVGARAVKRRGEGLYGRPLYLCPMLSEPA